MPALKAIGPEKLLRLIGTPRCPAIIDLRTPEDFAADPRLLPGAVGRAFAEVAAWAPDFRSRSAVVVCQRGLKLSQGVAAWASHRPKDAPQ